MKIIDLDQKSPEWLEWRNEGLGSSDIAALLGLSPWKTPYQLWLEKIGKGKEFKMNDAIMRGQMYESEAREKVERLFDDDFSSLCMEHEEYPWAKASLDGYCRETNEILEIKVPGRKVLEEVKDGIIPPHYKAQVQWQLWISGAKKGYFFVYWPETGESYIMIVRRDEEFIEEMVKSAKAFKENIDTLTPPCRQENDYLIVEDETLSELAKKYVDLDEHIKNLKAKQDEVKKEMLKFGNGESFEGGGLKFKIVNPSAKFDYEKMIEDYGIDKEEYKKKSSSSGSYRIMKIKEK